MTGAIIVLTASYLVVLILLLSLNLKSAWRWPVKAWAILVAAAFLIAAFIALEAMLGWPTEASPPDRFQLHAAVIEEPDRANRSRGAIFLWLSPRNAEGRPVGPPRAYALPYSRALHEQAVRMQGRLQQGQRVDGRAVRPPDESGFGSRTVQVELFEAPPPSLPPKTG